MLILCLITSTSSNKALDDPSTNDIVGDYSVVDMDVDADIHHNQPPFFSLSSSPPYVSFNSTDANTNTRARVDDNMCLCGKKAYNKQCTHLKCELCCSAVDSYCKITTHMRSKYKNGLEVKSKNKSKNLITPPQPQN